MLMHEMLVIEMLQMGEMVRVQTYSGSSPLSAMRSRRRRRCSLTA